MDTPPKRSTMRQIAKLAGVSAMTVSKALAGKSGVSENNRLRILDIANQLGYTPNMLAKSFRTDRTNTIGVIMSSTMETVFTILFQGIEAAAKELGYSLLVSTTADTPECEREIVSLLAGRRVDGVITTSPMPFCAEQKAFLDKLGIPYVLTVRSYSDPAVTTVLNNNYTGARTLVDHLVDTGGKRFLLLAMDNERSSSRDRVRGWLDSLKSHAIAVPDDRLIHVDPSIAGGYSTMNAILRKAPRFDTVVCGNDLIAIGAMESLIEHGIDIPGKVRLAGYDGIPLSGYLRVPLTTVEQPLFDIGHTGLCLLAKKIEDPSVPAQQVLINSKLVLRAST